MLKRLPIPPEPAADTLQPLPANQKYLVYDPDD